VYLVTAQQMREMDHYTIHTLGIPALVLMENAGKSVADFIYRKFPKKQKVLVLSGVGNNGGDSFVAARHLINRGFSVEIFCFGEPKKMTDSTFHQYQVLQKMEAKFSYLPQDSDYLLHAIHNAQIIVDGLIGTGLKKELRDDLKSIITLVNKAEKTVIAIDMPTGVDSDTGEIYGMALKANYTITFALPKVGQYLYPGTEYVGELNVAEISIPQKLAEKFQVKTKLLSLEEILTLIPERKKESYKGSFGHLLLIGGSSTMPGAITITTLAALKAGAGMVYTAIPERIMALINTHVPEAILYPLPESEVGTFTLNGIIEFIKKEDKFTVAAIGPGMGRWEDGLEVLSNLLKMSIPLVIDADALYFISQQPEILKMRKNHPTIITPHIGEMARLVNLPIKEIEKDKIGIAEKFAKEYEVIVVLKGANTIIAAPTGEIAIYQGGCSALAKAGSGDVLTGVIAALVAQKVNPLEAAKLGVYLHGEAGKLAAQELGKFGITASKLVDYIPFTLQKILQDS